MSDVGTYATLETELVTALSTPAITGLVGGVSRVTNVRSFLSRGHMNAPKIGVAWRSFDRTDEWDRCGTREYGGIVLFDVVAVVASMRGSASVGTGAAVEALPLLTLIETIHDRLERLDSTKGDGWLLTKEEREDIDNDEGPFTAAILTYRISAYFGR